VSGPDRGKGGSAPLTRTPDVPMGSDMLASRRSILFSRTDRFHLAPFDDQGYPFSLDRSFGEPHEAWPRGGFPGARN
jgi:hypothetical protein